MKYLELASVYEKLESTSKRLEKTHLIAELLKKTEIEELGMLMLLLQGRVYPAWDERKLGVASRIVLKAINVAAGISVDKIEDEWKKKGDLGIVAEEFTGKKKQSTLFSSSLDVSKVFENLKKLADAEGAGAVDRKVQLIAELLTSAEPLEAKYIVRTVLGELRVGVGEGSIRDAIVWAFFGDKLKLKYDKSENDLNMNDEEREEYNKYVNAVQESLDVTNDFSKTAEIAKTKGIDGLRDVELVVGNPIKVMLYQKAKDIEDAFETVGKPAALEYKYDGFRLQIHRNKNNILLFTRRLEDVTKQFPDVVKVVRECINSDEFILDAEVIGIEPKTGKWLAFQSISQRIKRKYDIIQMSKEIPVIVNIFDAVYVNGKSLIKKPFRERRALLSSIVKEIPEKLCLAKEILTDNIKEAERFYNEALDMGNEGIMVKGLEMPYKPGSRVGYGVKVKPIMETLDLVIVRAEWGEGKRVKWLSSFTIACRAGDSFLEVGRVGTGIKEKEGEGVTFKELTKLLKPLVIGETGREVRVKPFVVVEVNYEEIQKSPTYSSGFALRFPRLVRVRNDKNISEASDLEVVKRLYRGQR